MLVSVCASYVKSPVIEVSGRCFDLNCYSKFGTVVLGRRKYLGYLQQMERDFVARDKAARRCRQQPRSPNMCVGHSFDSKQSNCKCTITIIIIHIITTNGLLLLLVIIIVVIIIYYYAYY